ncbi:MAG: hypothetical protein NTW19_21190 [Planctomycetota bacterium]|nr:hypothetical protein [Planctomycetota bacterium]
MWRTMLMGCALASGLAAAAMAEVQTYQPRGCWVRVTRVDPSNNSAYTVERAPAAYPAATVDRALSQQPVHPWMYQVRVGSTSTWLDPLANYNDDGPGSLDENHFIPRSQREYISRNFDTRPYVITGHRNAPMVTHYEPLMTILKPDALTPLPKPNAPGVIPNAPATPTRKPGSVASAQ